MKSETIFEQHKEYILPVIAFDKTIIERGQGTYVYDVDGNEIIDLNGGQFCTIFGHSNPKLAELMAKVAGTLQHTNTATLSTHVLEAMKDLNAIMPEMNAKSILLATGSEAIEFALRYAKHITKKDGVVSFTIGYHGLTMGSQTVTYGGIYAKPHIEQAYSIETPKNMDKQEDSSSILEELKHLCEVKEIACVILEPIVSVGGMYVQTKEFLEEVKTICEANNVLLIFDECQTGFGRTGEWFGYQKIGVAPHIMVTAKGFGLGYPVSLVAIDNQYVEGFPPLVHYSSHQNDPFSAMITKFGIEYIKENNLLSYVSETGDYFFSELEKLSERNDYFSKPRGKGLMLACDILIDGVSDYRKLSADFREHLLLNNNLMLQATNGGQTLRFLPSYEITKEQIDTVISIIDEQSKVFFTDN